MSSIAGGIVQAVGSLIGGLNAQAAAKERGRQLRQAADQTGMEAGVNAMSFMEDAARQEAAAFVSSAAAGGFTGSAVDVLNDFSGKTLFNARSIIYRGQTEARNLRQGANVARVEGQNAMVQSVFQAGASLLGSYDSYRQGKAGVK